MRNKGLGLGQGEKKGLLLLRDGFGLWVPVGPVGPPRGKLCAKLRKWGMTFLL